VKGIPGRTFIEKDKAAVGAVGDIGCYGLDFALNSIGYPKPLTVSAKQFAHFGKNPKKYAEANRFTVDDDFAVAMIRCEGDIVIDYRASWAMNMDTTGDSLFFGTDAGLKVKAPVGCCWDGAAGDLILYKDDKDGKQVAEQIPVEGNNVKMGMFESKIRAFVDACLTGGPAPIPTSQIIYNQAIIDGIIRSNACGHEVEIDL
jgi:predicted dehydrogenase